MLFSCPKCGLPLAELEGRRACERGHSYDRARGGYYNLLLSSSGGTHGDNREMVLCRKRFLELGFYKPLSDAVCELVLKYTERGARTLDTGCGEGYYTDAVERALFMRDGESDVSAFDISKDAVSYAAKRNKRISTAVFGSYHMPIADGEFSLVLNMFSPNAAAEIHRVLQNGGIYLMAIPAEEHLFSLKAAIYEHPYKNEVQDTALSGFELLEKRSVSYTMPLCGKEEISALFGMTPYAYRTRASDRMNIESLDSLFVEADFLILVYRKISEV